MSEITKTLHGSDVPKDKHGVVQREQTFPAIPEPKYPANNPDVPGRVAGARPEWKVTGNSAVFVCTCGSVTKWNELPTADLLRGVPVYANCCNVGRSNPLSFKQPIEHARVEHVGLEVR